MYALTRTLVVASYFGVASISSATGAQVGPQAAREQQWLYRDVLDSGDPQPTAVFLSWDYSSVVFSATCDQRTLELVLRSELEAGFNVGDIQPMEISSASSTVRLQTRLDQGYFEGRTPVTDELATILRSHGDLQVLVPTEMGEPLHVGHAAPLRKLGLACRR